MLYGIRSNPRPTRTVPDPPPADEPSLHRLVIELGQLVGGHVRATDAAMQLLEDRITDLEGHIEHGPSGRCGVCEPDDGETVGAAVYRLPQIMNDDSEGGNDDD